MNITCTRATTRGLWGMRNYNQYNKERERKQANRKYIIVAVEGAEHVAQR